MSRIMFDMVSDALMMNRGADWPDYLGNFAFICSSGHPEDFLEWQKRHIKYRRCAYKKGINLTNINLPLGWCIMY